MLENCNSRLDWNDFVFQFLVYHLMWKHFKPETRIVSQFVTRCINITFWVTFLQTNLKIEINRFTCSRVETTTRDYRQHKYSRNSRKQTKIKFKPAHCCTVLFSLFVSLHLCFQRFIKTQSISQRRRSSLNSLHQSTNANLKHIVKNFQSSVKIPNLEVKKGHFISKLPVYHS